MKFSIEYRISAKSGVLAKGIHTALFPEFAGLPEECSGKVRLKDNCVCIRLECTSISKLRALNNSFIGVLLMLLEVAGEFNNE